MYCMLLDALANSFKLTVPSDVGVHNTVELVPATNLAGNLCTSNGFGEAAKCNTAVHSEANVRALRNIAATMHKVMQQKDRGKVIISEERRRACQAFRGKSYNR